MNYMKDREAQTTEEARNTTGKTPMASSPPKVICDHQHVTQQPTVVQLC